MEEFPKAKYHKEKPAALVNDPAEEKALGNDWYDDPDCTRRAGKPVIEKKSKEADKDDKEL